MNVKILKVIKNIKHNDEIFELIVENHNQSMKAGQFYGLKLNDKSKILRRPISINKYDEKQISFLIRNTKEGISELADLKENDEINAMGPLGNGFDTSELKSNSTVILYGGGIGIAPLLQLAKEIKSKFEAINIITLLGYRENPYQIKEFKEVSSSVDVFLELEIKEKIEIANVSYTYGEYPSNYYGKLLKEKNIDYVYSCGPDALLENAVEILKNTSDINTKIYVSLEERMACGIGACLCCTKVINENQGICVCKDGPVFNGVEVY
ncbi:MAG: FAD-binding oxidoreductase [Acidaminobacteraceae bacterium]